MTGFDRNAGTYFDGCAWSKRHALQSKEVIAEVFAWMRDDGRAGAGVQ
jgi:hypothetical protein